MVKLEYSGLSHQNTAYKNQLFIEGLLEPSSDIIVPVNTSWNGKTFPVQYLYYDSYRIEFDLRESEYLIHQKIQYAPKIVAYQDNVPYIMTLSEFRADKFVNEFYRISLLLRHESSKRTENIILNYDLISTTKPNTLEIVDYATTFFTAKIILDEVEGVDFRESVISEFKEKLVDYSIVKEYYHLRFFLTKANMILFYQYIGKIGRFSEMRFKYLNLYFTEFTVEQAEAGEDLFQMTIKLYKNNRVEIPTYQTPT